jgi:hypothetical protein
MPASRGRDAATREGYGSGFHYMAFWRPTVTNPGEFERGLSKMADFSWEVRNVG